MNAAAAIGRQLPAAVAGTTPHPNELDLRRIVRMLEKRARYRYVQPVVDMCDNGYVIQSPCCSRNVDASGGVIDIALIEYDAILDAWKVHRKDHECGSWQFHGLTSRLGDAIEYVAEDPAREFWP